MITRAFSEKFENCVTLNEILFPVWVENEVLLCNSSYAKRVVGVINNENFLLNQCSPRYELVPNSTIFPVIEQILNSSNIQFSAYYRSVNNARFYADYIIDDARYHHKILGTTDIVFPRIVVQHSYNGLTKYAINFGYFRMICTNGIVIPVEEMKQHNLHISGKHTESIKHSLDTLNRTLMNFTNNAHNVVGSINEKMNLLGGKVVLNVEDRIKEALGIAKINVVKNANLDTLGFIQDVISVEGNAIGMGGAVTDWLIYNGINQYIDNDMLNIMLPEVRATKDSAVFEYLLAN